MLQRAASNAFSWWWASHIRTKQSKWLEQNLLDMEEKVQNALNIIQKDGDSFAKRAEMYYRHRPDLICFVEETFKAYRALAERYDKLSRDLQKANTTIASIFPDQVPYDDLDDDDGSPPKRRRNMQRPNEGKIPKVPQLPNKNLKGLITNASKKIQVSKAFKEDNPNRLVPKSGLSEEEAVEEIDKIQKEILALQTVKEFTKSVYENGLSRYWEIENKINTMQQRVCRLQDEFKIGRVIEDGDARTVMAQAALKSCRKTLEKLEEKRETSSQAARSEHEKIVDVKQRIMALKRKFNLQDQVDGSGNDGGGRSSQISNQDNHKEAIKQTLEEISNKPLTVSELADKIDKLANNVIGLESTVSSQTAHIDKLRNHTGDLQTQIQNLEGDKAETVRKKLKEMEKKLHGVEDLEQNIEQQDGSLKACFSEARCSIQHLAEKLHEVQPDDEAEEASPDANMKSEEDDFEECWPEDDSNSEEEGNSSSEARKEGKLKPEGVDDVPSRNDDEDGFKKKKNDDEGVKNVDVTRREAKTKETNSPTDSDVVKNSDSGKEETGGKEESESNPMKEYTKTFKNYKETKKKLSKEDRRRLETLFELTILVRELKSGITKRDNEIQLLKQKIKQLQEELGKQAEESWQDTKEDEADNMVEIMSIRIQDPKPVSEIEERLRMDIDAILDENLDFWLRFSSHIYQVQKFKTEVEDLQGEIKKVKAKGAEGKTVEGIKTTNNPSMFSTDLRSEIRPIYKHLKEIQGELTVWLEQADSLKEELHRRCASLTNIQEEITMALKEGVVEEEIKFSTHQAAKFQGEILNMEQENNRVSEELKAGLHHIRGLHLEIKKTLRRLEEEFGLSENHNQYQQNNNNISRAPSRPGIPLSSFIFGVKARKQRPSIFGTRNQNKKIPPTKGGRS